MRTHDNIHVVLLPWSAFGHLMPFFNLSLALAEVGGIHVSFISTPKNIQRLPKVPPNLTHLVKLVEFPLPNLDDKNLLPADAEASVDLPLEKIQYLKAAYDLLREPIEQFIADQKPEWIIVDFFQYWIVEIAEAYDIPMIHFSIFPAASRAFLIAARASGPMPESLTSPVSEKLHFPSTLAYRSYEAAELFSSSFQEDASGLSYAQRSAKVLGACRAMVLRSCKEFEGDYLDAVHKLISKPTIPVGLLLPETSPPEKNLNDDKILKWLNQQKPGSVLFVGLGSECKPNKDQVYEIAYGIELSRLPFLWILQKPSWSSDDVDPLPTGFGLRTAEKGVVHIGWAPQKEILAHPSIGGTLSQGGWGSIIEILQHGHVLVVLPFVYDQGLNARLLVEKRLGIEVERNEEDGSFTRNEIAKALTYAMVSEEGEELRATTKAAAIFGDRKLHDSYIASFVAYLRNNGE
ncbi:putative UDP-rhamnose:rhamnosyltransferase 1 [Lycium ferocissimum]|uniref:putative UDP-rhamnose:rhamnosyltransferase 1 n=1 Tax=Lycium ferocissimum TaxID=112874 RepID=UPI00281642FA|nr:putative UDP-rhamnose:rhamnosyltransferase 1 [Lycium ferocissimum]